MLLFRISFLIFFLNFLLAAGMQQLDPMCSVEAKIVLICRSGFKTTYYYMDFTFTNLESPRTDLEACITYIVWLLLLGFA